MKYKINWGDGVFALPDKTADGLKLASGKAVKILVYIASHKSADNIENELGITGEELEEACEYWKNVGVMLPCDSSNSGSQTETESSADKQEKTARTVKPTSSSSRSTNSAELANMISSSEELRNLCMTVQSSYGRPLTFYENQSLVWINRHLGLTPEVIIMLVNYCLSIKKTSPSYLESAANDWAENNINTVELAEMQIQTLQKNHTLENKCASAMKLNRSLNKKEREIVSEWAKHNVSIELIMCAYNICIDSIGKVSFQYMNKIVIGWIDNNITTPEEAEAYQLSTSPNKQPFTKKNETSDNKFKSFDLDSVLEEADRMPLE